MSVRTTVELKENCRHQYQGKRAEEIDIFNAVVSLKCNGFATRAKNLIDMSEINFDSIEMMIDWHKTSPYAVY